MAVGFTYPCWVIVTPAPDTGTWVAQCLTFNSLASAPTPDLVLKLIIETTISVVIEDLNERIDPELRRAPDEDWQELWDILANGERGTAVPSAMSTATGRFAYQFMLRVDATRQMPDTIMLDAHLAKTA